MAGGVSLTGEQAAVNRAFPRVFFLHIPKCAGVSFAHALVDFAQSVTGDKDHCFNLDSKTAVTFARKHGLDVWRYYDHLLDYLLGQTQFQVVTGHFRYNPQLLRKYSSTWAYALLLRKPENMVLSYFHFARHIWPTDDRFAHSVEHYLGTPSAQNLAESYVSLLLGRERQYAKVSTTDIGEALENLKDFQLIGLVEDLPGFERQCTDVLGRQVSIPFRNQSPATYFQDELPMELQARISELCQPSSMVYSEAVKLIQSRRCVSTERNDDRRKDGISGLCIAKE